VGAVVGARARASSAGPGSAAGARVFQCGLPSGPGRAPMWDSRSVSARRPWPLCLPCASNPTPARAREDGLARFQRCSARCLVRLPYVVVQRRRHCCRSDHLLQPEPETRRTCVESLCAASSHAMSGRGTVAMPPRGSGGRLSLRRCRRPCQTTQTTQATQTTQTTVPCTVLKVLT
jgi:hypothetical protein